MERDSGGRPEVPKKLKILVVEDERIVARDLQVRLTNLGYQLTGTDFFEGRGAGVGATKSSGPGVNGYPLAWFGGWHRGGARVAG